ncbi:MAG: VacJ family lipoprotein [Nitrospirae bacterium]|nr:MAG: VacJ family lipoprotein [Nitrospirota bacterium]
MTRALALLALLLGLAAAPAAAGGFGPTGGVSGGGGEDEELLADDLLEEAPLPEVSDPLEPVNRALFTVNDRLYFWLLKPVARTWRHLPEGVRIRVANFFDNLTAPVRVVNDTLQGKIGQAGNEIMRFLVNSTLGIAGLWDVARLDPVLARPPAEDFGQTLARYGLGPGPYLVLPLLGPSTVRDALARVVDGLLDPVVYLTDTTGYVGAKAADVVNETSLDKDTYEAIKRESLDPYLTIRDAYAQHRAAEIRR